MKGWHVFAPAMRSISSPRRHAEDAQSVPVMHAPHTHTKKKGVMVTRPLHDNGQSVTPSVSGESVLW